MILIIYLQLYGDMRNSDRLKTDSAMKQEEKFSTILQAANRGVDLTGQILDFARDRRSETKSVNVSGIANEIYKLIKPSFPGSIRIKLESESDSLVLADEGQLHQIFMNICTNARLAMPDGGELILKIRDLDSSEAVLIFPDEPDSEAVEICFQDTGIGMSREVKKKIFDPFYDQRGWKGLRNGNVCCSRSCETVGRTNKCEKCSRRGDFYLFIFKKGL